MEENVSPKPTASVHQKSAQAQPRGPHGEFLSRGSAPKLANQVGASQSKPNNLASKPAVPSGDHGLPPLLQFRVTNPVKYLKIWWRRVMSREGIDFRFRVRPVTAVLLATVLVAGGAGFGWVTRTALSQVPIVKNYLPTPTPTLTPTPTPDPWHDTAYTGILRRVTAAKFYLQTGDGQAVTLAVPENINLDKLVGRRIFASGRYNTSTHILVVESALNLEILIESTAVPTLAPTPTPTPTPSATRSPEPTAKE